MNEDNRRVNQNKRKHLKRKRRSLLRLEDAHEGFRRALEWEKYGSAHSLPVQLKTRGQRSSTTYKECTELQILTLNLHFL